MRMTKCTKVSNHFYDADRFDSCPHCAKLNASAKSPEGQIGFPGYVKKTTDANEKAEGANNKNAQIPQNPNHSKTVSAFSETHKKSGIFSRLKQKNDKDDKTVDNSEEKIIDNSGGKDQQTADPVDERLVINMAFKSEAVDENAENEKEEKEAPAPSQSKPSLSQQINSVAMSGSIKDMKTVAFYNFETDSEPVVGWLVATNTIEKGNSFELKCGKNTVGRSGNGQLVDVSLDHDASVSRGTQVIVIYEPKKRKFLLQNANGSSLVYLNDDLLMSFNELSAYDRITIGETELLFIPLCSDRFSWDD